MRSATCFLLGVLSGVVGVWAVQRIQENLNEEDAAELANRLHGQLEELEGRLLSTPAEQAS